MGYVQTDREFTLNFDMPDLSFFNIPIPTPPPLPPVKIKDFGDLPMEVSAWKSRVCNKKGNLELDCGLRGL